MDWQPIETAPKDGTRVRLGHEQDASSMKQDSIFQTTGCFKDSEWSVSAFFIIPWGKRQAIMTGEPTHWQPLPPPYATKADGDGDDGA